MPVPGGVRSCGIPQAGTPSGLLALTQGCRLKPGGAFSSSGTNAKVPARPAQSPAGAAAVTGHALGTLALSAAALRCGLAADKAGRAPRRRAATGEQLLLHVIKRRVEHYL